MDSTPNNCNQVPYYGPKRFNYSFIRKFQLAFMGTYAISAHVHAIYKAMEAAKDFESMLIVLPGERFEPTRLHLEARLIDDLVVELKSFKAELDYDRQIYYQPARKCGRSFRGHLMNRIYHRTSHK